MTIAEYLKQHPHKTLASLAAEIGLHRGHLHKIATGERGWTSKTAIDIQNGTDGLVTPNDLARTRRAYLAKAAKPKRSASGGR